MTPDAPEPTEILVADERSSPWSSAGAGAAATTVLTVALYPCWSDDPDDGDREQLEYLSAHIQPRILIGNSPALLGVTRRVRARLASERHVGSSLSISRCRALIVAPFEWLSESPVL